MLVIIHNNKVMISIVNIGVLFYWLLIMLYM